MAKGNDGNLLQHCIEVELAVALSDGGPLHLVATHGMAPFEKLDGTTSAHRLFDYWLRRSGLHYPVAGLPGVLGAYKATGASRSRYPNSIELLRVAVGAPNISGIVCEVVQEKAKEIAKRLRQPDWSGSAVEVRQSSWRTALQAEPPSVKSSWLLTMDPLHYRSGAALDDDCIYREDLVLVRDAARPLLEGPQAGAFAVFSYTMRPETRTAFEVAMTEVFAAGNVTFTSTAAQGGNRHVAAIISNRSAAIDSARRGWATLVERYEQDG